MKTLYLISKSGLEIREIKIESETEKFYKEVGFKYSSAKETNYSIAFEKRKDAVLWGVNELNKRISHAKFALEINEKKLNEFKTINHAIND